MSYRLRTIRGPRFGKLHSISTGAEAGRAQQCPQPAARAGLDDVYHHMFASIVDQRLPPGTKLSS